MASSLFALLRSRARATLSPSLWRSLVKSYFRLETMLQGPLERRFDRRPGPLHAFQPLLAAPAFRGGPIVLVNSGLAPGGVERQIVNTLRGLERRSDRPSGLLGLRLGEDPELDFFKPSLEGFSGFVRNAVGFADARVLLGASLPPAAVPPAAVPAAAVPPAVGPRGAEVRAAVRRIAMQIAWMPWDAREEILRLAAEFASLRPAVVHGWQDGSGIPAAYAARLTGVPRILISTRNMRPTNFVWYRPHMYLSHRELAQCPEVVMINNSQAGAADYAAWLGLPRDRFVVKRNGLDAASMRRAAPPAVAALRNRLGIPPDAPVVGSIYRLSEEKRPLLWIETAREVAKLRPDCHFVIFGAGPMRAEVDVAAGRSGLGRNLHCPGTIADTALGLSLLDVFLLTSRAEGTPNVVLEASALGIAVVATAAGGTREAIDEGVTGYLVEPAEPAVIAKRIAQVLQAADWRARVQAAGPAFAERHFGLDRMISETLALYGLPPG
jgi:glycosyltransferase involved in cell wall biosynthesis